MNAASALILTVFLSACQMKHTFDRPPMEQFSAKDFNRNQVPGTKLFIATAADYIPDPVKGLFRKDAHTYVYITPEQMIGGDKALIYYGQDSTRGLDRICPIPISGTVPIPTMDFFIPSTAKAGPIP